MGLLTPDPSKIHVDHDAMILLCRLFQLSLSLAMFQTLLQLTLWIWLAVKGQLVASLVQESFEFDVSNGLLDEVVELRFRKCLALVTGQLKFRWAEPKMVSSSHVFSEQFFCR